MCTKIKILIAEHDHDDIEFIQKELRDSGIKYEFQIAENEDSYINALKNFVPDLILCDYSFHSFDGPTAFEIKEKITTDTPFILVSGKIGEERAVELIKSGVTDYVLKDRLLSLPSKIRRALNESKAKRDKNEAAAALQNALNDLNKIMDSSQDVICAIDENGHFIKVSAASEEVWGYKSGELIGKPVINFVYKEDREKTIQAANHIMAGHKNTHFENRYVGKDGSLVTMVWSARWDPKERINYGVARNATENKRLEKVIEIERERFYDLFLHAPSCIGILKGPQHVYEMANPLCLKLIGKKNIIGKSVMEILPEVEQQGFIEILDDVYKTGQTFFANERLVKIDHNGTGIPDDFYLNIIYQAYRNNTGDIEGIFFFAVDVTEQVLSRKKIENSEKQYRRIVETAQEGIWVIDEENRTSFVNKKMCEIIEYSAEELIGEKIYRFMTHGSKKIALERIESRKHGLSDIYDDVIITKSGKRVGVNISTNPVMDEDGKYTGTLAMMTDITARKRTDQEMLWLINNTEECFILLNHDLQIVSFNKQFKELYVRYLGIHVAKGHSILDYAQPERRDAVKEIYKRVLEGAEEYSEIIIPLPNATEKSFAVKYKPAKNDEEKIIGVFVSVIDITEKRKSEQQILVNEKRYRSLIENGSDAIVIFTADGKPIYISPSLEKVLGYTETDAMHLDLISLTHPDNIEGMIDIWQQALASPGVPVKGHPNRLLHKDGRWRWVEGVLTNMLSDPAVNGIVDNFRDVTEKMEAEEQKEFEKREKEALINSTEDLMWSVSSDFKLIAANNAFIKSMKEYTGSIIKSGDGLIMTDKFPPEFLSLWKTFYKRALDGESFIEEIYNAAGENYPESWAETRFNPIYDGNVVTGIACYTRDTTASKDFKNKLMDVNRKLETAQQTAQLGYWELSIDQDTLHWSDEVYKIWGVSPGSFQVNYEEFQNSIHPDDKEMFDVQQKLAFEGKGKLDIEHRIIMADGTLKYVHEKGELFYDNKGNPVNFEGTVQDITERKKAEEKIKESELRYRSLIEQATDAICIADKSMRFIDMNPYACKILGYTREEALQLYLTDILSKEELKVNPLKVDEAKTGGTIINERMLKRKDGTTVAMEVSTKMMEDGKFIMFGHDVTERKKAEQHIKNSERQLAVIYNTVSDSIFMLGIESNSRFKFLSVNQTFLESTGLRKEQIEGQYVTDVIPSSSLEMALAKYNEAITTKHTVSWEEETEYSSGNKTGFVTVSPVLDEKNNCTMLVGSVHDITERKLAQETLLLTQFAIDNAADAIFWMTPDARITNVNEAACNLLGYTRNELLQLAIPDIDPEYNFEVWSIHFAELRREGSLFFETVQQSKDGRLIPVEVRATYIKFGEVELNCAFIRDISERKIAEEKMKQSEGRFREIFNSVPETLVIFDCISWTFVNFNDNALRMFKYSSEEFIKKGPVDVSPLFQKDGRPSEEKAKEFTMNALNGERPFFEWLFLDANGKEIMCEVRLTTLYNIGSPQLLGSFIDITERKDNEEQMKQLNNRLLLATKSAGMGIWDWDIRKDELGWDKGMYQIYNINELQFGSIYEGWISRLHPEDKDRVNEDIQMAITGKKEYDAEFRIIWSDLSVHYIKATGITENDTEGNIIRLIGVNWDITELKLSEIHLNELNNNLRQQAKDLSRSNAELEQFAYVASHDLQEPLRMVTSFLTQLEKKYKDTIDQEGKKYIHFAVDGAKRMRQIILDLLEFSRVGRAQDGIENIDLNELISEIEILFRKQIKEKNAEIIVDTLPRVSMHETPIRQVFQNLISNALKYSMEHIPAKIHISVKELKDHWQFAVSDNGIGIEKEYYDKIFIIFQRLHNKDEFSGTGMGLALTKKIIETRGGKIWVESQEGKGSTFYFTVPL